MTAADPKKPEDAKRTKQGRSPAYPGINLQDAIAKAKALYDAEGKYAAPMSSAFKAWGFSAKSSGGRETRAALGYFGLAMVEGDREAGTVKLTEKALRILLDEREDQSEKMALIREVALTPVVHQKLLAKFPDGIKSDATAEHYLVFDEGYNKSAAGEVVTEFKATADYAGLFKPANKVVKSENLGDNPPPTLDIGDLVQVEIGGAFHLDKPKRVRAIQDDQGQKWVFIEGSETGIPMEQVRLEQKGGQTPAGITPPVLPEVKQPGMREEKFALKEGDVTITFPEVLSESSVGDLDDYIKVFLKKARREAAN